MTIKELRKETADCIEREFARYKSGAIMLAEFSAIVQSIEAEYNEAYTREGYWK